MGLSSSLSASVSGLNANAARLSTISDNISNSGTNGYKRSTVDFSSLVTGDTPGDYNAGGVRITTAKDLDARGSLIPSENPTAIAINGAGLLPVTPVVNRDDLPIERPLQLVPTGSFKEDAEGFLRTDSGLQLLGWPTDAAGDTGAIIRGSQASLVPVSTAGFEFASNPTASMDLGINLPSTETAFGGAGDPFATSIEYFDSLGNSQSLTFSFDPQPAALVTDPDTNQWILTINDTASSAANNPLGTYTITFNATGGAAGYLTTVTEPAGDPAFDETTGLITLPAANGNQVISLSLGVPNQVGPLTQFANDFSAQGVVKDGTPVGAFDRVEVDEDGFVSAIYDTGFRRFIFQIPVANVPNPGGLRALDSQAYQISNDSGPVFFFDAGQSGVGGMLGYTLEQSSVDISEELTDLIETQRAYSSNARVVTTVDEMLQETNNIKR